MAEDHVKASSDPRPGASPHVAAANDRVTARPPAAVPKTEDTVSRNKKPAAPEMRDSFREVVETIVFVVVLVLLLKSFLAEAFVIPTGSMATTLLGYHKQVE